MTEQLTAEERDILTNLTGPIPAKLLRIHDAQAAKLERIQEQDELLQYISDQYDNEEQLSHDTLERLREYLGKHEAPADAPAPETKLGIRDFPASESMKATICQRHELERAEPYKEVQLGQVGLPTEGELGSFIDRAKAAPEPRDDHSGDAMAWLRGPAPEPADDAAFWAARENVLRVEGWVESSDYKRDVEELERDRDNILARREQAWVELAAANARADKAVRELVAANDRARSRDERAQRIDREHNAALRAANARADEAERECELLRRADAIDVDDLARSEARVAELEKAAEIRRAALADSEDLMRGLEARVAELEAKALERSADFGLEVTARAAAEERIRRAVERIEKALGCGHYGDAAAYIQDAHDTLRGLRG